MLQMGPKFYEGFASCFLKLFCISKFYDLEIFYIYLTMRIKNKITHAYSS